MILLIFNWVSAIMLILILTIPFCRWENWGSAYFVFFSPVPNYGSEPGFSPHSLLPEPNYVPTMPLCFFILFLQSLPWFFVCHSDCTRMGLQVCSSPFNLVVEHFQQQAFSSSSLSAIRVVSSAYLRLLIFLPAMLIPACVSSSPAFLMMYSAYNLNKQDDNIQPWRTPFPI